MNFVNARILLTGASGGLGGELARQLAAAGATLLLAGRDADRLASLQASLGAGHAAVAADLTEAAGIALVARRAQEFGVNVLINNAGSSAFGLFDEQPWPEIERVLAVSLQGPMRLTQALLPWLKAQPAAVVVNIGSAFGSLPFAGFAAYSAAKAGLRGFSQALRRELADSLISVVHVAPRAIATQMNGPAVNALNQSLGNRCDSPERVARQIVTALKNNRRELHIGFPECLFAWLNGFVPGLIDAGVAGKLPLVKQHAARRSIP